MQTQPLYRFSFFFLLAISTMNTADAQSLPVRDPFISDAQDALVSRRPRDGMEATDSVNVPDLTPMKSRLSSAGDDLIGIIVGSRPYALVNQSGEQRLLSIGDTFQGHKIVRITLERMTFDDASSAYIPQVKN